MEDHIDCRTMADISTQIQDMKMITITIRNIFNKFRHPKSNRHYANTRNSRKLSLYKNEPKPYQKSPIRVSIFSRTNKTKTEIGNRTILSFPVSIKFRRFAQVAERRKRNELSGKYLMALYTAHA